MARRVTDADLKQAQDILNRALEYHGSTTRYRVEGRYGYIGIDRYDAQGMTNQYDWRMLRVFKTGHTKREAADLLEAMIEVLGQLPEQEG